MLDNDIHRAYLCYDKTSKTVVPSHPMFAPVAEWLIENKRDFNEHEAVFLYLGGGTKHLMSAVVHNSTRGPGAGGVRYWPYDTLEGFITEGLRLSSGMGRKNSLAGLWWGGGKGVVHRQDTIDYTNPTFRDVLFSEYGEFMSSLRGPYVTAEDLGVTTDDMHSIFSTTRFTTCIPEEVGGSGNPSIATGYGVACAIEAAFDWLKLGNCSGKTFAIQGSGNVATYLVQRLLDMKAQHIILSDVSQVALDKVANMFDGHKNIEYRLVVIGDNSILFEDVDCVCPCATGGTLNTNTIPRIKARVVCGAANNQLFDDAKDGALMSKHNRIYVPDFLANRMGIVNCANEQYGRLPNDPAIMRHFGSDWSNSIWVKTQEVLTKAFTENITTSTAANKIADNLMKEPHPIWPDRSRQIIQSLMDEGWDKEKNDLAYTSDDDEDSQSDGN